MLFNKLTEKMKKDILIELIYYKNTHQIKDILFLDGKQTFFSNTTLYFGYDEQVQNNSFQPSHCILGRTNEEPLKYCYFDNNIAIVHKDQLFAAFNSAKKILNSDYYKDFYEELIELVAKTHDIHTFVNAASAKLGNSVILLDLNYNIISYSTTFPIADVLWKENISKGYCSYDFIRAVNTMDAIKRAPNTPDAVEVTCPESSHRKLISKVIHNDMVIGNVLMIEKDTTITPSHIDLLRTISLVASETLSNYIPYLLPSNTVYEQLLYDLLIGAPPEDVQTRIQNLSFPSRLLAFSIVTTKPLSEKHLKKHVSDSISNLFPDAHITFYNGGIAALASINNLKCISAQDFSEISLFAKNQFLRIGISNIFTDIKDFATYYQQAHAAINLDTYFHKNSYVCRYDQLHFYDLLNSINDKSILNTFCQPALKILQEYDKNNDTDLYNTLRVYLEHSCSSKLTAEALFIHRNSLAYRLERISKITDIDLNDYNVKFLLNMSYHINYFLEQDY